MHSILFEGQLLPGYDAEQVRNNLATLFKTDDPTKLDRLFSGQPVSLKKNLDQEAAKKYLKVLNKAGLVVRVDPPFPQDDELLKTLSDFPELAQKNDLSFNTVMQSFSNEPLDTRGIPDAPSEQQEITEEPPAKKRQMPGWLIPVLAPVAALLVCAVVIFWPTSTPQKSHTPLTTQQQQSLENLFEIAATGSDQAFEAALKQAPDEETRAAMRELRALADDENPDTSETPSQQ